MRSARFGRRIVEARGTSIVLVPDQPEETDLLSGLIVNDDHKAQIHAEVMSRINPSAATRVPRETLRVEIAKLVSQFPNRERTRINDLEGNKLAVKLTDDMIGLGPIEPLLKDDEVTDILV